MPIFLLGLLKNKWTWIIVAFVVLVSIGYSYYKEYQNLRVQHQITRQNLQAATDSLTKLRDTVQTLTIFVGDLNEKNSDLEERYRKKDNEYRILYNRYDIAIDRIEVLNQIAKTICTDSTLESIFNGKHFLGTYDGKVIFNKDSCTSTVSLNVAFDPIDVRSEVYFDETDELWKVRTMSKTLGVKLRGISALDKQTLQKISGVSTIDPYNDFLGVGLIINPNWLAGSIKIKPSNWMFEFNYNVGDKLIYDENSWMNQLSAGVTYFIF